MPSGFQQDQNQLTPSYYRVVINMVGNATWYGTGDEEDVEKMGRISTYAWDNFEGDNRPTTQAIADALARGNLRFQYIVEAIENLADCQILDIEHTADFNADDMANNDKIAFTVKFDRDEGVLPALMAIKKAQGWNSDGNLEEQIDGVVYPKYYTYVDNGDTVNNTQDAIRDVIWDTLGQNNAAHNDTQQRSRSTRVFQPVDGSEPLTGEGIQAVITTETPWDNGTDAWADIQVNEMDGTTTINQVGDNDAETTS
jgi:hypothetical protein